MIHRPLIPMGALTGRPTEQQLRDWLDAYRRVGIDQFMIYARSGLEIEYLSAEWFAACRHIIEHAARHGMAIWIYDEFNWPSGGAGGKVLAANPGFAARKLLIYRAAPTDFATEPVAGGLAHCRIVQSTDSHAHDVLNPDAMDCFIRLTHEQYAKHFSAYFGGTIKGFFTDEPSFAYGNTGHCDQQPALKLPWYPELEREYHQLTGCDFRIALADHLDGRTPANLWSTYTALLGARFRFAYTERISRWCEKHGLIATGHFTNEFSPRTAIAYSGDPLAVTRSFTMPGIDEIFSHATLDETEWLTLKTVEQAAVRRRTGAMAELFALGPCGLSMARRRQMIWLAALHGADHYLIAVSSLDARANAIKQDYYHPFTPDQPWFEGVRELGDEAVRAAEYARKDGVYPVAVRFPQSLASEQSAAGQQPGNNRLDDLLRCLVKEQWPMLLLAEDDAEPVPCQVVLTLKSKHIHEEKQGLDFDSLSALSDWLDRSVKRPVEVVGADGRRPHSLVIKSFVDGSAVVVSLSGEWQNNLTLRSGEETAAFSLPPHGVFTFSNPLAAPFGRTVNFPGGELQYRLERPNTMRVAFHDDSTAQIELLDNLAGVRIVTRRYGETVTLELDGTPLPTGHPCHSLPPGFQPLYTASEPLDLPRGTHQLRLISPAADYPFLPAAFLVGDFAVDAEGRLKRLPERLNPITCFQNELRQYTGYVDFFATLDGRGAEHVQFNHLDLMSELLVNGQSLGRRLWSPFRWEFPENCRQTNLECRLRITTSIGPLFGEPPASFLRKFRGRRHWFNPLIFWPGPYVRNAPAG